MLARRQPALIKHFRNSCQWVRLSASPCAAFNKPNWASLCVAENVPRCHVLAAKHGVDMFQTRATEGEADADTEELVWRGTHEMVVR